MGSSSLKRFFKRESSTEEEIKQLVDEDEGELEKSTREMINNIFEFDDLVAGDIMTHRTDMVAVPDTATLYDVAKASIDEGCSRIPVYKDDLDNILGIIYVNSSAQRFRTAKSSPIISASRSMFPSQSRAAGSLPR